METKKILLIGKSDATITMVLDNLESKNLYPEICVLNNLNLSIIDEISNEKFNIKFKDSIDNSIPLVMGVSKPKLKKNLTDEFKLNLQKFINVIHNSSQISSTVEIGNGCLINSLVSIAAHTKIGNFVNINRNTSIGHHVIIEDYVTINPGCNVAGNVVIGNGSIIGIGTNIIEKIRIGKNTVVGAGSVVTKDLPDNVIAYGNPCKIIKNNG